MHVKTNSNRSLFNSVLIPNTTNYDLMNKLWYLKNTKQIRKHQFLCSAFKFIKIIEIIEIIEFFPLVILFNSATIHQFKNKFSRPDNSG